MHLVEHDWYCNVSSADLENPDGTSPLKCNVRHVDGTMNALKRNQALDWLKAEPADHLRTRDR
jgi:predicted helicase